MIRPKVRALIQCAMPLEAAPFLAALGTAPRVENIAEQEFYFYEDYVVAITGIGLSNGSAGTARALMMCEPDIVIAAGTTGGLHVNVEVGDIAVATNTIYSMADATAFGYEPGQLPGMPVSYNPSEIAIAELQKLDLGHPARFGRVVSADAFVTADNVEPIRARFPDAIATDMETTGMAQVCYTEGVDWISLRAVSDLCGPKAGQDFHIDASLAAAHSCDAVWAYLGA
ncbi:5'-methylthioadenosine/S-adenosylhomocysteine nucleosidase [Corynebacterium epidermidicanis]|uniref:adenosylhomocysteine nucleosidase n=1 Tax=Corynebacterium epidermidicanis TaxID=1050174 RepID=A0A0G3GSY7_9CORY|nr:5'-methylthioadenosine/S-adenosylhomocysteine nucleosidase [Corynebacterium epidermidicanis]AKK04296.1 5'-methylthioadenosine/S-adenosylhomocysteine nucleosidase [Corynebacterium epidermidicanis]